MQVSIDRLRNLYRPYSETIKPLLALIEAEREEFPLPLYNEVRALNDHVARALVESCDNPEIELEKAERHIARINLDCFKWLNITFDQKIEKFRKDFRYIDQTKISNGEFYFPFRKHVEDAKCLVKEAKIAENGGNISKALELYQKAFNEYDAAQEMTMEIDFFSVKRIYSKTTPIRRAFLWILLVVIGWGLDKIEDFIKSCFE